MGKIGKVLFVVLVLIVGAALASARSKLYDSGFDEWYSSGYEEAESYYSVALEDAIARTESLEDELSIALAAPPAPVQQVERDVSSLLASLEAVDGQKYWSHEDVCNVFAYAYQRGYTDARNGIWCATSEEYVNGYDFSPQDKRTYDFYFSVK